MVYTGKYKIEKIADELEELSGEFYSQITRIEDRYLRLAEELVAQCHGASGEELQRFWKDDFTGTCGSDYARSYESLASFAKVLRDRAQDDNRASELVSHF